MNEILLILFTALIAGVGLLGVYVNDPKHNKE